MANRVSQALAADYVDDAAAATAYESLTGALNAVTDAAEESCGRDLRTARGDVQRALRRVARGARRIREQRAAQARREQERRAAQARLRQRCGEAPSDMKVEIDARTFMRMNAHDPDSVEFIGCGPAILSADACWVASCRLRARNGFGAMTLNSYRVTFANDRLISMETSR